MTIDTKTMCAWLPDDSVITAPSQLDHLKPKGAGTPFTECLTSYLSRLAATHDLSVNDLVRYVVSPHFNHSYFDPSNATFKSFLSAAAMNGRCTVSEEWVRVLESLTLRKDLVYSTFLPFKEIIPDRNLLRKGRAWCPLCLEECHANEQTVYEPLLWKVNEVKVCPVHRCKLTDRCPQCGKESPNLARWMVPGYCTSCGKWLGNNLSDRLNESYDHEFRTASAIGELIATGPKLNAPPVRDHVAKFIHWILQNRMKEKTARALARLLGVNHSYVLDWLHGEYVPSFPNLVQICACFKVGMADMLTLNFEEAAEFELGERAIGSFSGLHVNKQEWTDWASIRTTLEQMASGEKPAIKVSVVARMNNCHASALYRNEPNLCKAVTARVWTHERQRQEQNAANYEQQVRNYLIECKTQGEIPPKIEIFRKFGGLSRKRQQIVNRLFEEMASSPQHCEMSISRSTECPLLET